MCSLLFIYFDFFFLVCFLLMILRKKETPHSMLPPKQDRFYRQNYWQYMEQTQGHKIPVGKLLLITQGERLRFLSFLSVWAYLCCVWFIVKWLNCVGLTFNPFKDFHLFCTWHFRCIWAQSLAKSEKVEPLASVLSFQSFM